MKNLKEGDFLVCKKYYMDFSNTNIPKNINKFIKNKKYRIDSIIVEYSYYSNLLSTIYVIKNVKFKESQIEEFFYNNKEERTEKLNKINSVFKNENNI